MQKPGPTKDFPEGKLNPHDEGGLNIAVGHDKKTGKVVIQFGTPVAWIGMNPKQAMDIGKGIIKHAKKLLKGRRYESNKS